MINYDLLIEKYINKESPLYGIYYSHVAEVSKKALDIADRLGLSRSQKIFINESAMLHDIGIIKVKWPPLHCNGEYPYLHHWIDGYEILSDEGLTEHAEVAKRHATPPINPDVIRRNQLPGKVRDYEPVTIEQRIIAYSDLFSSKCPKKNSYVIPKNVDGVIALVEKYSPRSPLIIKGWAEEFGDL